MAPSVRWKGLDWIEQTPGVNGELIREAGKVRVENKEVDVKSDFFESGIWVVLGGLGDLWVRGGWGLDIVFSTPATKRIVIPDARASPLCLRVTARLEDQSSRSGAEGYHKTGRQEDDTGGWKLSIPVVKEGEVLDANNYPDFFKTLPARAIVKDEQTRNRKPSKVDAERFTDELVGWAVGVPRFHQRAYFCSSDSALEVLERRLPTAIWWSGYPVFLSVAIDCPLFAGVQIFLPSFLLERACVERRVTDLTALGCYSSHPNVTQDEDQLGILKLMINREAE
ncbi:hypothetical protein DFH07DRAFT_786041 [Mycena maculata]|uniref:Uncharacterized protein n=1 Tax=Mycena maculata TaxID=230809 RepID=A0AAD7H4C4_9AGAR|nr:hypothetical protein DFH07DRAFT_786041 [Mycena maculata]